MRSSVKSMPYRQAISAKTLPEVPVSIPIEERKWRHIFCAAHTTKGSFEFSLRVVKVSRHSLELRESDGAIPGETLMYQCKGFERTANGIVVDWKTCLETGTINMRLEYCLDKTVKSST